MEQLDRLAVLVRQADEARVRTALESVEWEERGLLRRLVRPDLDSPWRRALRCVRPS